MEESLTSGGAVEQMLAQLGGFPLSVELNQANTHHGDADQQEHRAVNLNGVLKLFRPKFCFFIIGDEVKTTKRKINMKSGRRLTERQRPLEPCVKNHRLTVFFTQLEKKTSVSDTPLQTPCLFSFSRCLTPPP